MTDLTLDDLPFDRPARVQGYSEDAVAAVPEHGAAALRLIELGLDVGTRVVKRHGAPFGRDPIAVEVGGHMVAMRRADARLVHVRAEQE